MHIPPVPFPIPWKVILTFRLWILLFSFSHQIFVNNHESDVVLGNEDAAVREESINVPDLPSRGRKWILNNSQGCLQWMTIFN